MKKITILLLLILNSCITYNTLYNPKKHEVIEKLKYVGTVVENTNAKFTGHYLVVKDTLGCIDTIPVSPKIYNTIK